MTTGQIVRAIEPPGQLPHYELSDAELGPGASLGNGRCWVNTGTDGRVHSLFCIDVGEEVAGPLQVRYCSAETRVAECSGAACSRQATVPLTPVGHGRFIIHPAYQKHFFDLPGDVGFRESVVLPVVAQDQPGD